MTPFIEMALYTAARMLTRQVDNVKAEKHVTKLARPLDEFPFLQIFQEYAYTIYHVMDALDRQEEAEEYLQRSNDWIQFVADNFDHEAWQQTWLEEARRNQEIPKVAQERGVA